MRILFVCMGNICRSPVVEAVARSHFARAGIALHTASAGTVNYHIGAPADPRAAASAKAHGYDLSAHRAREIRATDFAEFDWILAMDQVNLRDLSARGPSSHAARLGLFLQQAGVTAPFEVPDPYYGGSADFEHVIELAESGVAGLIGQLR